MFWERSDVQAARILKNVIVKHSFSNFHGADIVSTALSIQWLDRLIEYLEEESKKKPEIKNPEIKPIPTPEGPKESVSSKLRSKSK